MLLHLSLSSVGGGPMTIKKVEAPATTQMALHIGQAWLILMFYTYQ